MQETTHTHVPKNLSPMVGNPDYWRYATAQYGNLFCKELEIEATSVAAGRTAVNKILDKAQADDNNSATKIGLYYVSAMHPTAMAAVKTALQDVLKPRAGVKPDWHDVLRQMVDIYRKAYAMAHPSKDTEGEQVLDDLWATLTSCAVSCMIDSAVSGGQMVTNVAERTAKLLVPELQLVEYITSGAKSPEGVLAGIDKRCQAHYRVAYMRNAMQKDGYIGTQWDNKAVKALCFALVVIIAKSSVYFEATTNGHGAEMIQATQEFLSKWASARETLLAHTYRFAPMVIPPRPWTSYTNGGYYGELAEGAQLLRLHDQRSAYGSRYIAKLEQTDMPQVYKAVNAIQATPWRINKRVLAVMDYYVLHDVGRCRLPRLYDDMPPVLPPEPTEKELASWKRKMSKWYTACASRTGRYARMMFVLSTARDYAQYDKFYIPCNMDFRGRIYPIPMFSFQGDDINKSLLLFANAPACKSLVDIQYLARQVAYTADHDKWSYAEREQWVADHEQDIIAVTKDPINNLWWETAGGTKPLKKPWQFLAACYEWADWVQWRETHNGDPAGFVSSVPCAMDGTCSGLQHYSAILRDPIGADAVNLVPTDKPHDIYGIVASKVQDLIDGDKINGTSDEVDGDKIKYGTRTLAQHWDMYGIDRSVTKRATMTLAYGSKTRGFAEQLIDDIIKPYCDAHDDDDPTAIFNSMNKWSHAMYMAKLIWQAVQTTVVAAVSGMAWLQKCAQLVTKQGDVVTWTTPMGLPIQQSYLETIAYKSRIRCAGKQYYIYHNDPTGDIDKRKQSQGIAPNYIHSLDASHLMLTVDNCVDAGLHHYATIHDSFAAPASQAHTLYTILRQSFVQLYTEHDVLEELRDELGVLSDKPLPPPPPKGAFDLSQVLNSKYIFC